MSLLESFPRPEPLKAWPAPVTTLPPGRYLVAIPIARLLSGQELTLTVHIVRGGDGPVLGLFAGIHGDETPGVRSIRDVLVKLAVERLGGTVIAVPVANPLAWQAQQRTTPERDIDRANLARVFRDPATPRVDDAAGGSLTRRIAATLEQFVYPELTHLIDYHCYGRDTMVRLALYRTEQTPSVGETSARMTRRFGLGVLQGVRGGAGTTSAYAAAIGVPTCVVEMGGTHTLRTSEDAVARLGADGARRVMHLLGMIAESPAVPEPQLVVDHVTTVRPQTSGFLVPAFDLEELFAMEHPHGIPVRAGDPLGQLFDTYTLDVVETLVAPEAGFLIGLFSGGPYQVGGPGLSLAQGDLT